MMRETCELSPLEIMQTGQISTEIQSSPQLSRKADPNVFVEFRQSRTGSKCGKSFCIQCSVDCPLTARGTRGRFMPGENDNWNKKCPEFPNFREKGRSPFNQKF